MVRMPSKVFLQKVQYRTAATINYSVNDAEFEEVCANVGKCLQHSYFILLQHLFCGFRWDDKDDVIVCYL